MTKPKTKKPVDTNPKDIAPQSKAMELKQWRLYKPSLLKDPEARESANEKIGYRVYRELANVYSKNVFPRYTSFLEKARTKGYCWNVWFYETVNDLLKSESKHISRPILKHVREVMDDALKHSRELALEQLISVSPRVYSSRERYTKLEDFKNATQLYCPAEAIGIFQQLDPRIQMGVACNAIQGSRVPLAFLRLMALYALPRTPYVLDLKPSIQCPRNSPTSKSLLNATEYFIKNVEQQWADEIYAKTAVNWYDVCQWYDTSKQSINREAFWTYTQEEWQKIIHENEEVPN